ncbi:MAG: SusC/RagA family TonB-linked outer membrane protein, partial [Bacteroidales bacterium]
MRIAIVLFILGILQAHANDAYSQKTKLTLNFSDAQLITVLDKIENESKYFFLYNEKLLDTERKVSIDEKDQLISVILDELFKSTDVNYTIIDRKIILAPNYLNERKSESTLLQQQNITGKVIDSQTGEVMTGVNIQVKGTTIGAITDLDGKFILMAPDQNATLIFSFIGYISQEVQLEGKTVIDIKLMSEMKGLDEVVVVGYGTTKKASLTGAVAAVKGSEIQASPATNFTNTLAGRLPGVVTMNNSGEPGNDNATIRIRGVNTLGDNSPLIVVDGVANRDMTRLDPSVIETVTVLKDASAAIYGAQAANGVILITTKRGVVGKPKININYNYGLSNPTVIPRMADAKTYATMINEIDIYSGVKPTYSEEELQKFGDGSDPWAYPNVNWFDKVFKPYSNQQRGDISISGGTEGLKYFVSGGFNTQGAIYRNSDAGYSQVDLRTNIDGSISENISLSFNMSGRQENRNFARTSNTFTYLINRSKPIFLD